MPLIRKTRTQSIEDGRDGILSDDSPDAYGDVCEATRPDNWVLDRFRKNPLALLNHSTDFPIGTWKNVRVEDGALRGTLHLAPKGTSPRHDEVRALIDAKILVGLSVGFKPIESVPIPSKGMRYTKMELMECSVVSVPANENALMRCRSLGISAQTQQLLFKEMTIGARIRKARRAVRKAKALQERADTPSKRATMERAKAQFEKEERELRASLSPRPSAADRRLARSLEVRARAIAKIREIDARIARDYAVSPAGQQKRHTEETIEAFTRAQQQSVPSDPPKPKLEGQTQSWRGQKLPPMTWRGRKI
jgi:HK97 family phage prohead protease